MSVLACVSVCICERVELMCVLLLHCLHKKIKEHPPLKLAQLLLCAPGWVGLCTPNKKCFPLGSGSDYGSYVNGIVTAETKNYVYYTM